MKDVRLNLSRVMESPALSPNQAWSVALCSALFLRADKLAEAILADAQDTLSSDEIEDAQAAASLMGMNTVYYRFRHMIGKPAYSQLRPSLRMNRIASPATSKAHFELCSLACAALAGCEVCLQAHEESMLKEGLSEDHVHDAVRIAAVIAGLTIGLP